MSVPASVTDLDVCEDGSRLLGAPRTPRCRQVIPTPRPSERVIQPTAAVTPVPTVAGPVTGGQRRAQLPSQFNLVAVSGANQ